LVVERSDVNTPEDAAHARELLKMINGSWIAQACYVTARLGIADLLAAGPRSAQDLAAAAKVHAPALQRLLGALGSIDLCRQLEDGRFELTPLGSLLRADVPCSMRGWALHWGGESWRVWGNLLYSVTTGESARALITGTSGFAHLDRDPEAAAIFNQAMVDLTRLVATEIAHAYDFSGKRVMDVGGGYGELLAQILLTYPAARGVLLDMPHAIARAHDNLGGRGLEGRCEFVCGDFFLSVPSDADVYVLKSVIHDWPDERATAILRTCHQAMLPGARLLVIERLMPARLMPRADHEALARADLHMLVALAAQERTLEQVQALLGAAGFVRLKHIETQAEFQIIEAQV
jgi:orsellinic acid C2-O-methyltransferase